MSDDKLTAVVIGLGGFGSSIFSALDACEDVEIVGVSDRDQALAEQTGRSIDTPYYCDNRSLLAETKPQVAFLCVPPMVAPELVSACAKRGIHVWKDLPLARNLDEGVAMVQQMDSASLKFAIGTQWRFAPGYSRAVHISDTLEQILIIRGQYFFNWGSELGWRSDKTSAGGGALLELGYHPVDTLLAIKGLPEEVYGMAATANTKINTSLPGIAHTQPPHDTDDSAAGILRYRDGTMATIITCRTSGPFSGELTIHSPTATILANFDSCTVRGPDGNTIDHFSDAAGPAGVFSRQIESFVNAIRNDEQLYMCSARENLLNLAVLDAIYLSDQTRHVERPTSLLEAHKLDETKCLIHRPPATAGPELQLPQE